MDKILQENAELKAKVQFLHRALSGANNRPCVDDQLITPASERSCVESGDFSYRISESCLPNNLDETTAYWDPKSKALTDQQHLTYVNQTRQAMEATATYFRAAQAAALPHSVKYTKDTRSLSGTARVLYGIATSSAREFPEIVDAVFETWAKELPREQLIIAGGLRDDDATEGLEDKARIMTDD